jgi:hypothetical protein
MDVHSVQTKQRSHNVGCRNKEGFKKNYPRAITEDQWRSVSFQKC